MPSALDSLRSVRKSQSSQTPENKNAHSSGVALSSASTQASQISSTSSSISSSSDSSKRDFSRWTGNSNPSNNNANSSQKPELNSIDYSNKEVYQSSISTRIPTGITGFDNLIQGGFRSGTVNLLSGGPGTGKTIFCLQFILYGIYKNNEPGILLSFDEQRDSIFENAKTLGWDLEDLSKRGLFTFVNYSPEQLQKILNEGGGLLDNLMTKIHAKRFVIDPITTFLMMSSTEYSRREQLLSFFKLLKKWNVTTLLTNEYTPVSGNEISKQTLSVDFEVDSIIQMYYTHDRIGQERTRLIEVYKMRGTAHPSGAIPFAITSKGIVIVPRSKEN